MTHPSLEIGPCYDVLSGRWTLGDPVLPEGPIQLFEPFFEGTEDLPTDFAVKCTLLNEYSCMMDAIAEIVKRGKLGRFMWSRREAGRYLGFLNYRKGAIVLIVY